VEKFDSTHSELRKQPVFAKNLIENIKFQDPVGRPPVPSSDAHACRDEALSVVRVHIQR